MKKTFLISTLSLVSLLILTTSASAGINDRLAKQHRRIHNGVHDGSLTRSETKALKREQRRIHDLKERFLRNGRLSRNERRSLNRKLDHASDHIYRLKHNKRNRYTHDRRRDCEYGHRARYPYRGPQTRNFYSFKYYEYGDD